MRRWFVSRMLALVSTVVLSVAAVAEAQPVVSSGFDPAATVGGAVRYRALNNNGNGQVWIGAHGTTPAPPAALPNTVASPSTANVTWLESQAFTFSYDPTTGVLATSVRGVSPTKTLVGLAPLNYIEITILRNNSSDTLNLSNVSLVTTATHSLGSFVGATSPTRWKVTGEDLSNGFTLSGTFQRAGSFGGGDSSYVQIDVGYLTPPPPPPPTDLVAPETSAVAVQPDPVVLNGEATVRATIDDTKTGGSKVISAHYRLDDGAPVAMSAVDGDFDGVVEDVEATFTASAIGTREVCVYGTDEYNNAGDITQTGSYTCQNFLVTYKFDGFFKPIDTDLVNVAKAGQAVPAKWRLTDAEGVPIEDAGSFVGLFSYPVSCSDFSGTPTDAVGEDAPGASGLQYHGDGYWQYNWKTPTTYANSCRAMYVEFNSGAISPVVRFQFKK